MATRSDQMRRRRVAQAFADLMTALGKTPTGALASTPLRAAILWTEHLVPSAKPNLSRLFRSSPRARHHGPVILRELGVHLVCPHHLTIAFGQACIAYCPGKSLAGFGAIARLVEQATGGFVLQEEAARLVAEALVAHLGATAAVVLIEAKHPCHNVTHPRSHKAVAETWAQAGDRREAIQLRTLVLRGAGVRPKRGL